jgi:hypothetical protein
MRWWLLARSCRPRSIQLHYGLGQQCICTISIIQSPFSLWVKQKVLTTCLPGFHKNESEPVFTESMIGHNHVKWKDGWSVLNNLNLQSHFSFTTDRVIRTPWCFIHISYTTTGFGYWSVPKNLSISQKKSSKESDAKLCKNFRYDSQNI